jgi:hypothetical protein
MILVFLTATYWFLSLLNVHAFDFAASIADALIRFVHIFYKKRISIGGQEIDGALLMFDFAAVVLVVLLSKFKITLYSALESVQIAVEQYNEKIEEKFNSQLQADLRKSILKNNNAAILVEFSAKNLITDDCWNTGKEDDKTKEQEDYAFKMFYNALKQLPGCKFAKTDNKMLILVNEFSQVNDVLKYTEDSISRIRMDMRNDRWRLNSYIALEAYNSKTDLKEIYPSLLKLLVLRQPNEVLAYGNFCMRYELESGNIYEPKLMGSYSGVDDEKVWSLIRKDIKF